MTFSLAPNSGNRPSRPLRRKCPECWLEIHCPACRGKTLLPIKMLASRYGQDVQIGAILGRLSCKRCSTKERKVRPGEVWLTDRPGRRDIWDLEGWAVQLIGA